MAFCSPRKSVLLVTSAESFTDWRHADCGGILVFMSDVTRILSQIEQGDPGAGEQLLPLVYEELRKLARHKMVQEAPDQTLQATALVHEAYMRLVDVDKAQHWNSRGHFFGAAAEAMRRILVDRARRKNSARAGGGHQRVELSQVDPEIESSKMDLIALSEAIDNLAAKDSRKAELVKLRFFAGLSNDQAAETLGISSRTAYVDWAYAKAFLRVEVSKLSDSDP
jgi:RNA polymerase sigma factor (TIGR02999 family)